MKRNSHENITQTVDGQQLHFVTLTVLLLLLFYYDSILGECWILATATLVDVAG
jgi:hypothetical protein